MADGWDQFKAAPAASWDQFQAAAPTEEKTTKSPPDFTLGRWAGLTGRNLIQGAAALPATLADIPAEGFNLASDAIRGRGKGFRFNEMNQNVAGVLDKVGFPRPETGGERIGSGIAQGIAGAGTGLGVARGLQGAVNPATQAVGRVMGANPGRAGISGGLGGAAAAGAGELGLPWYGQAAAGLVGGGVPYARPSALVRGGAISAPEQRAMDSGFVVPPATMEKPSVLSTLLGGWSGKVKSQQAASVKNQALTKQLAAGSLGLPRDTVLDDNVFRDLRANAGKAYENVKQAVPVISTDPDFAARVSGLGSMNSDVAAHFPELVKNDAISNLANNLAAKSEFPTSAGVEAVKILRANGTKNLQAIGDPEKHALGFAQRDAADAIDDLMDRNISAAGNPGVVEQYRQARRLIARSHDIESATNTSTGEIDPRRFALLADKGKPLGGDLGKVADAANSFPKAMQVPSKFGGAEPISILDIITALGAAGTGTATGHLGSGAAIAGAALGRPAARALTLSGPYQRALQAQPAPLGFAGAVPGQIAIDANLFRKNQ